MKLIYRQEHHAMYYNNSNSNKNSLRCSAIWILCHCRFDLKMQITRLNLFNFVSHGDRFRRCLKIPGSCVKLIASTCIKTKQFHKKFCRQKVNKSYVRPNCVHYTTNTLHICYALSVS